MRQSTVIRLQRIEKRRNPFGDVLDMTDDQLLAFLRQEIRESGGIEMAAAAARVDRDAATALIIEASEGCRSGAELMTLFEALLEAGRKMGLAGVRLGSEGCKTVNREAHLSPNHDVCHDIHQSNEASGL
jgi:hypothetical protein